MQDGAVALDAPVSRWFPNLPKGERIAVRDPIAHTSGLPEFQFDLPMDCSRQPTPQALVDYALHARGPGEPEPKPASGNAGHIVAGMLVEVPSGDTLAG